MGVHIRRTDKLHQEASKHEVWEYFEHVDRFFEGKKLERPQVFIATDDPSAVEEARKLYGEKYEILNIASASKVANKRMGKLQAVQDEGTILTISDILLLGNSDFFVGTFSSQISRMAFELMSSRLPFSTYQKQQKKPDRKRYFWTGREKMFQTPPSNFFNASVVAISLDDYYYHSAMSQSEHLVPKKEKRKKLRKLK